MVAQLRKQFYVLLFLIVVSGCAVKDSDRLDADKNKDAVGVILGEYDYYEGFTEIDTAKARDNLESELEKCVKNSVVQRSPRIKVIPTDIIKRSLANINGSSRAETIVASEVVERLEDSSALLKVKNLGLRYLAIVDIRTDEQQPITEAYNAAAVDSSGALGPIGLKRKRTKLTNATLSVMDVNQGHEIKQFQSCKYL